MASTSALTSALPLALASESRSGRLAEPVIAHVAPHRTKARGANPFLHPGSIRAVGRPSARDDVLFEHHAAIVVGTDAQRDLADVRSLRDPGSADVIDVVEQDATQGLLTKVKVRSSVPRLDARPLLMLEVPAKERREPARLVLQLADLDEVVHAVSRRIDGAVHHGGARTQPHLMSRAHDSEPLFARTLRLCDTAAHAVDEDLGSPAGHRVEPRP